MQASLMVISSVAFALLGFVLIGGPMMLVDLLRRRRQQAVKRQIALTDALDGRLGAVVAPVVTKRAFGPWEIQIAVPFQRFAAVGRNLSVVDDVFSGIYGGSAANYRIVLRAKADSRRGTPAPQSARHLAGARSAAA